jgi:tetratricopeptide (TPR) repeat protein
MFSLKKIGIRFSVLFLFVALLWQGSGFLVVADDDDTDFAGIHEHVGRGDEYHSKGDYKKALGEFKQAAALLRLDKDKDSVMAASIYDRLGFATGGLGDFDASLDWFLKALAICEKKWGKEHGNVGIAYLNAGLAYDNKGNFAKAEEFYQKALEIQKNTLGKEHPSVANTYNGLGILHYRQGNLTKAEEFHQKALEIRKKTLGEDHLDITVTYSNLGIVYKEQGKFAKAEEFYQKALEIQKKKLNEDHPDISRTYNNLGTVYDDQGSFIKAEEFYKKALEIRKKVLGENHPDVATSYNNLGFLYNKKDEFAKAEEYFKQALEIQKKSLGEDHIMTANSYSNIGILHYKKKNYELSLEYLLKSYKICSENLGKNHNDTKSTLDNLKAVQSIIHKDKPFDEWLQENLTKSDEPEKPRREIEKKTTKRDFKKLSIEISEDWTAEENNDGAFSVTFESSDKKAMLAIILGKSDGMDSETLLKSILESNDNASYSEIEKENGYCMMNTKGKKDGKRGMIFAGTTDELSDLLMLGGEHPELISMLRSIKFKEKRPFIKKMITAAAKKITTDLPVDTPPKKNVTTLNLSNFSIEVPKAWTAETDKETGIVTFTLKKDKSVMLFIFLSQYEETSAKEFVDSFLSSSGLKDSVELMKGGYYKAKYAIPNGVKGCMYVGAKNGLAEAINVVGKSPDFNAMLLSIKAKKKRPYLDKIIADITNKTEPDEDEDESDADTEGRNDRNDDEIEPVAQNKPAIADEDLEQYKVDFSLQEIRDPKLNNELAVTVAVPDGWKIKNSNVAQWNPVTYGDPARISVELNGQEDEAYCEMFSPISFRYDYGMARVIKFSTMLYEQKKQEVSKTPNQNGSVTPEMAKRKPPEYKDFMPLDGWLVREPLSAEECIKWAIEQDKKISDVKIKKVSKPKLIIDELEKVLPELSKQVKESLHQSGWTWQFNGITTNTALVEFTCVKNGKLYEQRVGMTIIYIRTVSPINEVTKADDEFVMWTIAQVSSAYALAGKLKKHEVEIATILNETKINPIWRAKVDYLADEVVKIINEKISKQENNSNVQKENPEQIFEAQKDILKKNPNVVKNKLNILNTLANANIFWANELTDRKVLNHKGKKYFVPNSTFSNW